MNARNSITLESVALSVTSTRSVSDYFRVLENTGPGEIFRMIEEKKKPEVQDYLKDLYGVNPLTAAESIVKRCEELNISILHYWHDDYPQLLRNIYNPPVVLYSCGKISRRKSIALVGSRKADTRSRKICSRITHDLADAGFNIVSGMAVGIDRAAHVSALDSGGSTTAVLANGIDRMYPRENVDLYQRITETEESALVSEYPPGAIAGRWTFVRRNRIISGLSLGTVVVKAAKKSGALITAGYAIEQNRDLFVCPGNSFDSEYEGCMDLLKNGANPVFETGDIFDVIGISKKSAAEEEMSEILPVEENPLEKIIMAFLESGKCDIDTVIRKTGALSGEVINAVMCLELKGLVARNGNYIELNRVI